METEKKPSALSPATATVRNYHAGLEERARRTVRMVRSEVGRALQETSRVLRIMVSLHSAEDYPSVLRLYGLESSPSIE
jgi:hypothetical protein